MPWTVFVKIVYMPVTYLLSHCPTPFSSAFIFFFSINGDNSVKRWHLRCQNNKCLKGLLMQAIENLKDFDGQISLNVTGNGKSTCSWGSSASSILSFASSPAAELIIKLCLIFCLKRRALHFSRIFILVRRPRDKCQIHARSCHWVWNYKGVWRIYQAATSGAEIIARLRISKGRQFLREFMWNYRVCFSTPPPNKPFEIILDFFP